MKNWTTLPHEKLIAYQLNIVEATGRSGSADQKRVYAIARGEVCEAAAALDIAAVAGGCAADTAVAATACARGVYALPSGLIR